MKKILLILFGWWFFKRYDNEKRRQMLYMEALRYRYLSRKPLINIGCGNDPRYIGDVNLDIEPSILPNFVQADACNIPYPDKYFGVAIAFHILEHLEDPQAALAEWSRVADMVIVETPSGLDLGAWLCMSHKWVFWGSKRIRIAPVVDKLSGVIGLKVLEG